MEGIVPFIRIPHQVFHLQVVPQALPTGESVDKQKQEQVGIVLVTPSFLKRGTRGNAIKLDVR